MKPKGIFGGHLNIRSLMSKHEEIKDLLMDSNLDFLCLSESWLHSKIQPGLIDVPGFKCFRKDRSTGKGGGVVIYIRDSLKCTEFDPNIDTPIEHLCLNISLSARMHFRLMVIYNPPSHDNSFYVNLQKLLKFVSHKSEVIIFGDFNIDWSNRCKRKKLKTITGKFDLSQIVTGATRITKSTRSQIDLIFTNKEERITKVFNLVTGLSDHNLTLAVRKLTKKRFPDRNNQKSNPLTIPRCDLEKLERELGGVQWDGLLNDNDPSECCNELMNIVSAIVGKFLKTRKYSNRKQSLPWINASIRKLMKQRDLALKTALKSSLNTDMALFKGLRNRVTKELRNAKAEYYISAITNARGNSASIWKQINSLIKPSKKEIISELKINNNIISESEEIAEEFNNFFIKSVEELAHNFKHIRTQSVGNQDNESTSLFVLKQTNRAEVLKIIDKFSNSHSKDLFNLDTAFLKKYSKMLVDPLTHLINLSIKTGKFPDGWKKSRVIPIFKSGAADQTCNYRPISILPVFSKVLEKIVAAQLMDHLETHSHLHSLQFGFRSNHSTESANCFFVDQLKLFIDRGNMVGAVFLDLKKAFDTINHDILISKLSNYNFSDITLKWFKSYLCNREQCVVINNKQSTLLGCNTGVPQGSILGPILFSLYINDLPASCPGAGIQMYADDTVIYVPGRTNTSISTQLTDHLESVSKWLERSCLTLNIKKTVSICFSSRTRSSLNVNDTTKLDLKINGQPVDQVTEVKYLGLRLDPHLKFEKHVQAVNRAAKANLYTFKMIRNCLTSHAANIFMHSMIFSYLGYCATVWSQAGLTVIRPLEMIYNRAVKILDRKPIRFHHCHVIKKLNILSFDNFTKFANLKLIHKCIHNQAPRVLGDMVEPLGLSGSSTRGAAAGNCKVPLRRSSLGQTAFSVQGVKLWNALPTYLKQDHNWDHFKLKLKEFLKSQQSCPH